MLRVDKKTGQDRVKMFVIFNDRDEKLMIIT